MPIFSKKSLAFTLAEVLITLGIIGIVAEMTIPTLMNNVQEQKYYSSFKKIYSEISNTTNSIISENSGLWDNSSADSDIDCLNMKEAYKQYFSYLKEGTVNDWNIDGWYGYKSKTKILPSTDGSLSIILKNGTVLRFSSQINCSHLYPNGSYLCGDILFDVNGSQKPNMLGKDTFDIVILKDSAGNYKTAPPGESLGYTCNPGTSGSTTIATSYGCTEKILLGEKLP